MTPKRLIAAGIVVSTACLSAFPAPPAAKPHAPQRFDLILAGGRIIDGTGAPWYVADVGIRNGKIVRIGRLKQATAARTIDASGLVVAPGFIDMMGQTATPFLEDPESAVNLLSQGITTINAGEGDSAAPLDDEAARHADWKTLGEYFLLLEQRGLPMNVAQTVGHTQIRRIVLGEEDRQPTEDELRRMQELVRQAMQDGATGLSTALIYPPAVYASTDEIAALAKVVGEYGGRYYTHMRNEGDHLLEAIDEALDIGRKAGTPVHIFHLKAAGRDNWPKIDAAIARIKAARAAGQQVTADIYPYIHNGLGIEAFIHPRHFAQGRDHLRRALSDPKLRAEIRREMEHQPGWENWYRHMGRDWDKVILGSFADESYSQFAGQSLAAIAEATGKDPWEVFFHIAETGGAFALPQSMNEANKIKLMRQPFVSFCTDAGPGGSDITSHPRSFGAFPRLVAHYVRELGVMPLEQAVSQASAVAANEIMAYDRGRIAEGLAADLVVFDPEQIVDRATFAKPRQLADGVKFVLVNGEVVLEDGKYTGRRPGRVLRGPGYRPERVPERVSTGGVDTRMAPFDRLMQSFMKKHGVPGAALAVTDHGRLVYARGFGYADLSTREQVTPTSLFRIASVSKPITAVAILQLVEQKKLSLDDRVFDLLKYEPFFTGEHKFDERHKQITIRHLLRHRGGWDRNESFDPMFQSVRFAEALGVEPPAKPEQIIRFMLGRPLDFDPGTRYAYSNFGYCLLGRVIETVTGTSYEDYVKQHVLAPLGIHTMRVGRTRSAGRAPNEVKYYTAGTGPSVFGTDLGTTVPEPYGAWYLEAMDSHGAWIASAVDLARFAAAFDDPQHCPVLSPESIHVMFALPANEAKNADDTFGYALGWMIRTLDDAGTFNAWHTGSLPGTATLLVRRHDGRNWIVLFNARRSRYAAHLGREIDPLLHQAANAVKEWPQIDLFHNEGGVSP